MISRRDLLDTIRRVEQHGDSRHWLGPDPYEGLNATRLVRPLTHSPIGRRVLIQAVKRSPVDLRPALGIDPTPNSATAAWVVSSYARGGFLDPNEEVAKLEQAVHMLLALRSPEFSENSWGYQFPTQSRVFYYRRNAPSTVATAWAGHALLDAADRLERSDLVSEADSSARFLLEHVPQTNEKPGSYFGYLVDDRSPIHNSNLHACALLARVGAVTNNDAYLRASAAGVRWSLACQRNDGSWPYGERANLTWVDGFHTGYVLEALQTCHRAGVDEDIAPAWERGIDYYDQALFTSDDAPKYYSNSLYPIDASCVAQAIQTFAMASTVEPTRIGRSWATFGWALQHLRRRDGLFMFQRRRCWANRIPHMRWAQVTMLLAMTHLLDAAARVDASAEGSRST